MQCSIRIESSTRVFSRLRKYLLSVSWMTGAEKRLSYSYALSCVHFPPALQMENEHRCEIPKIIAPHCLANHRDANLLSPNLFSPRRLISNLQNGKKHRNKVSGRVFAAWCMWGLKSATRTGLSGSRNTTLLFKSYRTAEFLLPHWREGISSINFPSQSSCFHREGWNAAGSPKRSGRRKTL